MHNAVRRWRKTLLALAACLCLLSVISSLTRAEHLPVKTYTTADGLARDSVNRIIQDSHGFLWFATAEGLSRFDGYKFTSYGQEQGLPHRSINDVLETRAGVLWVATGNGVARFNPMGNAQAYKAAANNGRESSNDNSSSNDDNSNDGNSRQQSSAANSADDLMFAVFYPGETTRSRNVTVLLEDHAGVVWCGTEEGLYQLDQVEGAWKLSAVDVGLANETVIDRGINALLEDRRGAVWIGAMSGLYQRTSDGQTHRFTTEQGLPDKFIRALLEDRDGRIWVGTSVGLCSLIAEPDGSRPHVTGLYTLKDGLRLSVVDSLFQSGNGDLLIAGAGGLCKLVRDGDVDSFQCTASANGVSEKIQTLAEDREGNLWLGTVSEGALKISRNGFTTYHEADGLTSPGIAEVFENHAGELFVVTSDRDAPLNGFDGQRFAPAKIEKAGNVSYTWGWYQTILQDSTGDWWVPTVGGLYRYANQPGAQRPAAKPKAVYKMADGLTGDHIFRLYEDSRGDIWIGTINLNQPTLNRWERATETFHQYTKADGLGEGAPTAFREDAAGNVWIGFYTGGLARYRDGHFDLFNARDGVPEGLIHALTLDHTGRLWVATAQGGLCRIDDPAAAHPKFITMTTADGLSSNQVNAISEDKAGRIYVGTGRGIDLLDSAMHEIKRYTTADGLPDNFINISYADRQGVLWFGTLRGLARFAPQDNEARNPPPILFSGLHIAGQPYKLSELGVAEIPKLELSPDQNQLQIDFFSIGYGAGETSRYEYMLNGADKDWSAPTPERSVSYARLAPGTYEFRVRALNSGGVHSPKYASVQFTILPPVYRRWWFLTLAALAIGFAVFSLDRYRVARLKELDAALSASNVLTEKLSVQRAELHKANRALSIEYEVTRILADSTSSVDATPKILQTICENLGWDIGAVWDVEPQANLLRCVSVWQQPDFDAPQFIALTHKRDFAPGEGLPGQVWAVAEAMWIADIAQEKSFPRFDVAADEGVRSGFGFPILFGSEVIGVIEFFKRELSEPDRELLEMMTPIGAQIGQLIIRKRGEESLRESETRFRTLAETASDAIITIDEASTIIYVNLAAEKIFGYTIGEMSGADLTMLMPEYLRHLHNAGLARYTGTGRKHIAWAAVELPGLHKSGAEIPLELSFGDFTKNDRRYFTGIARDITERKRAEETLQRTREERLIELEKVRKRIASDLHDDIGSSLTQISLLSEVLRQRLDRDDAPITQPLAMIATSSRELVDSMSDIVWAINPQKDHLSDLTQRMRSLASEVFTACNIKFRFRAPVTDVDVPLGANLRREVFLIYKESVNNIVKHSGGTEADIEFSINADSLLLRISDNGQGFDQSTESDGHGLVSMRERSREMGGALEIVSHLGRGTTTTLHLPLAEQS